MALPVLATKLKLAANQAFQDNRKLTDMSAEDREKAACFYESVAATARGSQANLARLYNLERARFLRGEIPRIAPDAVEFGVEIGYTP
ncbi:MAG TPA: hypothetical protein VKX17_10345 [Planctomycetota bacterium]|nr:hypothetical protein [Planctomycetota bacterium]